MQKVAPYLTLDSDAYPAVVDGKLVWIVDGYTTSDQLPVLDDRCSCSTRSPTRTRTAPRFALDDINYIRNSVKATVDAYDGTVTLYAWDDEDPMLQDLAEDLPVARSSRCATCPAS